MSRLVVCCLTNDRTSMKMAAELGILWKDCPSHDPVPDYARRALVFTMNQSVPYAFMQYALGSCRSIQPLLTDASESTQAWRQVTGRRVAKPHQMHTLHANVRLPAITATLPAEPYVVVVPYRILPVGRSAMTCGSSRRRTGLSIRTS